MCRWDIAELPIQGAAKMTACCASCMIAIGANSGCRLKVIKGDPVLCRVLDYMSRVPLTIPRAVPRVSNNDVDGKNKET
jgi:hypothetical protein